MSISCHARSLLRLLSVSLVVSLTSVGLTVGGASVAVATSSDISLGQVFTIPPASGGGITAPQAVAVVGNVAFVGAGSSSTIFAVDLTSGQTQVFTSFAPGTAVAGGCRDGYPIAPDFAQMEPPTDMTTDGQNLYMASDCGVRKLSLTTGAITTVSTMIGPGVLWGPDGWLYATYNHKVWRIDPTSSATSVVSVFPLSQNVYGLTTDGTSVFVGVAPLTGYPSISRISLADFTTTTVVTDRDLHPEHITMVGSHILGVTGFAFGSTNRIRRYDPADGTSLDIAGNTIGFDDGVGGRAGLGYVEEMALAGSRLIVADANNNAVRELLAVKGVLDGGGATWPGESAADGTGTEPSTQCSCGDPVNTATGALWETSTDVTITGRGVGLDLSRSYDSQFAGFAGRFGYGWTDSYAMSVIVDPYAGGGSLATSPIVDVVEGNGAHVPFARNTDGTYSAATRIQAGLVRHVNGTWTYLRGLRAAFDFDATGALTQIRDVNGYATTLAYDANAQLSTVTDPTGRQLTYHVNGNGLVSSVSDPTGHTVSYGYDANTNLTSVTDPAGNITHYGYDSKHRLTTVTDPRGQTTTSTYDIANRVTQQIDRAGRTTLFAYTLPTAPGSWTVTVTDPRGIQTRLVYVDGELTDTTKAVGTSLAASWSYTYDSGTNGTTTVTDPLGHTQTRTFDNAGNELTVTDGLGHTETRTYDNLHDLLTVTDRNGVTTTNTYDAAGNLLTTSTPLGPLPLPAPPPAAALTAYHHSDATHPDDVTSITDPSGKNWTYSYDTYGDRTATTDPLGNTTTFSYNTLGWLMNTVSARGNATGATPANFTTTYTHDPLGRVTEVDAPAARGPVTTHYDPNGNVDYRIDGNGKRTDYTYNNDDQRTTVTRPDGTTQATSYYPDGSLKEQTDGLGHVTHYNYDALGHLTDRYFANGTAQQQHDTYSADRIGNLQTATDPSGRATTYSYDAANRVTAINYADPDTPDVTAIGYTDAGQRTTVTDGSGTSTWTWDSAGRLTEYTNGTGRHVGYSYDPTGHPTAITYPNGKTVTRDYWDNGALHHITDWLGHTTTFHYDPDGNLDSQTDPNGVTAATGYDNADALTSITDTLGSSTLASFGYTRTTAGQLNTDTATGVGATPQTYGYDNVERLTAVNTKSYSYDAADRLSRGLDNTVQGYDAADHLTDSTPAIELTGPVTGNVDTVGTASTLAPTALPTGTVAGSELVLAAVVPSAVTVTTPTGYTRVADDTQGSTTTRVVIFVKTATASEAVPSVSFTNGTGQPKIVLLASYRGVDTSNPVDAHGFGYAGSGNDVTIPSISAAAPGEQYIAVFGATSATVPGTFTMTTTGLTIRNGREDNQPRSGAVLADASLATGGSTSPQTAHYSQNGQLLATAITLRPAVTTYSYDAQGNRTSIHPAVGAATTLGYDQANRLVSYGPNATYAYNADGLRTRKTVSGLTTTFTYDGGATGLPQLLETRQTGTGAGPDTSYIYGPDNQPIEQLQASPTITLVGTPTTVADTTGGQSSLTTTLPSGIHKGDQILVGVSTKVGTTVTTSNANYTRVADYTGGGGPVISLFLSTATGSDSAPTFSFTGGTLPPKSIVVAAYAGVDPDNPIDPNTAGVSRNGLTGATSLTIPAVTPAHDGDTLVGIFTATGALPGTWNPPGSMSLRAHTDNQPNIGGALADQTLTTAGSTGPRTATYTSSGSPNLQGILLALRPTDPVLYYHHDQLGSTRALTDNHGTVVAAWTYDPYGRTVTHTGTANTPLLYNGQYQDTETGNYYLRARYYDPTTAQFLTRDPIEPVTQQPYQYANGDPLDVSDPLGLCGWTDPLGCVSDAASATAGYVGDHWHGIAQGAVAVGTAVAIGGCIVATEGICAGVVATYAVNAGIGAASGAAGYALSGGTHTLNGYLENTTIGALTGLAGTACYIVTAGVCSTVAGRQLIPALIGGVGGVASSLATAIADGCEPPSWRNVVGSALYGLTAGLGFG
jgi:RHS repeat-associated protein